MKQMTIGKDYIIKCGYPDILGETPFNLRCNFIYIIFFNIFNNCYLYK